MSSFKSKSQLSPTSSGTSSTKSKDTSPRTSLHEDEYTSTTTTEDYTQHKIQTIDFAPGSLIAPREGGMERKKSLGKRMSCLVWNPRAKYSRRGKLMELMG
ncbi:hypothetical protein VTL71DRAFT_15684 [Oculimacula yallundae]|uniref:Uncharacterized protein n=1 Tax=Oculimacula yallundae TaxID=86028 RepID=A0ABR4CJD6_9HELO